MIFFGGEMKILHYNVVLRAKSISVKRKKTHGSGKRTQCLEKDTAPGKRGMETRQDKILPANLPGFNEHRRVYSFLKT